MNWFEECKQEAEKLTQQKRQQYLNLMNKGKTIGEANEICKIGLKAGCGILNMNIFSKSFLRRQSV